MYPDVYCLSVQVLLSVPLCLLCLPLSVQRAVQQPGARHLMALHPGESLPLLLAGSCSSRVETGATL